MSALVSLTNFADLSVTSSPARVMETYTDTIIGWICGISLAAFICIVTYAGIKFMTASGEPDKLQSAKKTILYAFVGLGLVFAASFLVGGLVDSHIPTAPTVAEELPTLETIENEDDTGFWSVLTKATVSLLRNIVQSAGEPFLKSLSYFLNQTPMMAENASVFNLWFAVLMISGALLAVVVAMRGLHLMSFNVFGFEEQSAQKLVAQIIGVVLLMITSIFVIDAIIWLSNGMIHALKSGFVSTDIWGVLADITKKSGSIGIAGLLVMVAFLTLSVMLLVYYILRLVSLYLGAILSPLIILLFLVPAFKDFAMAALKTYITTIFVLFVHVVILLLASSLIVVVDEGNVEDQPNNLMALIVGLATVVMLLKTQGFMQELSYAASAPRAARELSTTFLKGFSNISHTIRNTRKATSSAQKVAKKINASKRVASTNLSNGTPSKRTAKPLKTGEVRKASK